MREFVAARGRGDRAAMQRWWGDLLSAEWPRVRELVNIRAHGRLINQTERDDALAETAGRLARRGPERFAGTSLDSWFSFVNTVADFSVRDVQRAAAERSKDHRSFDERDPESGDPKAWVGEAYATIERTRVELEELEADEDEDLERRRAYLAWAVPQLSPKRRAVWEALAAGKTPEAIAEELGMSRNSVDQTKKRAIMDLIKLKESYPS